MADKPWATVQMGAFTIPIYLMSKERAEGEHAFGMCIEADSGLPEIYIQENLPEPQHSDTLTHELLHQAAAMAGISLSEQKVTVLARFLSQATFTFKKDVQ